MNKQKNLEYITTAMQELQLIISQFEKYGTGSKFPEIEIDLALEKTRKIYNEILQLNKFALVIQEKNSTETSEKTEPIKENLAYRQAGKQKNIPVKEPVVKENKVEIPKQLLEEKISEPAIKEVKTEIIEPVKNNVAETVSLQPMESIIDVIFKQTKTDDFASKLQQKPITDINEAIGLGEKMLYINELFDKNLEKYTESIKELNNFNHLNEALAYINSNFFWNAEKEATISFLEIVKRKFPV